MRRLFPHPFLAIFLLIFWLILQQSASLGHILLGGFIAIVASMATNLLIPEPLVFKKPLKIAQFIVVAGADIIRSNLAVMLILFSPRPEPDADFIEMKLELTHTFGLAILACIITATPGSAWLEYDRERSTVLIHVFDLVDAEEWIATIRNRYETLLLEIFQ